jgi:predicted site-specific integrase-resolvase
MNTYDVTEYARLAGVAAKAIQRWEREGRLKPEARTPGNRRLYTQEQLNKLLLSVPKAEQVRVVYLRVSSQAQKLDLADQKAALEQFWITRRIADDEWISEIGGGLNFRRPKFSRR